MSSLLPLDTQGEVCEGDGQVEAKQFDMTILAECRVITEVFVAADAKVALRVHSAAVFIGTSAHHYALSSC